jgi:peptide/nickel transport system substrate-binding protein
MFLELRANGIDRMGLTPLQYTRQTESNVFRKNYQKFRYLSFAYTYLGYNLKNPLFSDKRVRQAIAHAVNRQEIIDGVLLDWGSRPPLQAGPGPTTRTSRHTNMTRPGQGILAVRGGRTPTATGSL